MAEEKKKKKSVEDILKAIQGDVLSPQDRAWYSTGSFVLDTAIANGEKGVQGGFPGGLISMLWGEPSAGKSTMSMHSAADAQKQGKVVIYVDFERSFSGEYANRLGVDTTPFSEGGQFILYEPDYLEDAFEYLTALVADKKMRKTLGLIIFDSIASMSSSFSNEELNKHDRIGVEASSLKRCLKPFATKISGSDIAVVLLNQVRMNLKKKFDWEPKWITPGGMAPQHSSSLTLQVGRGAKMTKKVVNPATGMEEEVRAGHLVRVNIMKNKITGENHRTISIPFFQNLGIDLATTIIDVGESFGLIAGAGKSARAISKDYLPGLSEDFSCRYKSHLRDTLASNDKVLKAFEITVAAELRRRYEDMRAKEIDTKNLGEVKEEKEDK